MIDLDTFFPPQPTAGADLCPNLIFLSFLRSLIRFASLWSFSKAGFRVISYGTGSAVRLPGPSIDKPNIYPFGTPYNTIYEELVSKDPRLWVAIVDCLDLPPAISGPNTETPSQVHRQWPSSNVGPEQSHQNRSREVAGEQNRIWYRDYMRRTMFRCCVRWYVYFSQIAILDQYERVWQRDDWLSIDLMTRGGDFNKPVHVINMEIRDNHEEALIAGKAILDLASAVRWLYSLYPRETQRLHASLSYLDRSRRRHWRIYR